VIGASRLDGASTWTRIFRIDLPLIMGQIKLIAVLTIIQTFQRFVGVLILTDGGPANSTMLPGLYLFQRAFQSHRLGYASAVGLTIFLFILTLTLINQFLLKSSETGFRDGVVLGVAVVLGALPGAFDPPFVFQPDKRWVQRPLVHRQ